MNTEKTISIRERKLEVNEGMEMIFDLLDAQINNYKTQYLIKWEKNHQFKSETRDNRLKKMEGLKNELNLFFKTLNLSDSNLDLDLEIIVNVKEKRKL